MSNRDDMGASFTRFFDRYIAPFCIACGVIGYCLGVMGIAERFGK